jgi:lysozyme
MSVLFADVSHHQGVVNWAAYKAAGHDRVMIKATGGATDGTLRYADPLFAANWRGAGAQGLRRGAYHYARNNNPGAAEWDWFWQNLQAAGGLRPGDWLCYDQEDTRPGAAAAARQRTVEFIGAAVRAGHPSGEVYSGRWYLEPAGIRAFDLPPGWRRLWISDYTPGQPDAAVELPAGWDRDMIVARQHTDRAAVAGVASPCDYNRVLREWGYQEEGDVPLTDAEKDDIAERTAAAVWQVQHAWPARWDALPHASPSYRLDDYLVGAEINALRAAEALPAILKAAQAAQAASADLAAQVADLGRAVEAQAAAIAALQIPSPALSGDIVVTGTLHATEAPTP